MNPHHLILTTLTLLMNTSFSFVLSYERPRPPPSFNDIIYPQIQARPGLLLESDISEELLPSSFALFDKPYNLAEQLDLDVRLAFRHAKANSKYFDNFWNRHFSPISLSRNWYLPIQNWGSLAKYYDTEIVHAKESRNSLLLGFFQNVEKRSKIGLGLHYTDLSDDVTNLELDSGGLFINYIVEY